jgi:hypothetical protein
VTSDGQLSDYLRDITGAARAVYRPEDAYAGNLVSALGAINAGITTLLDWSHIGNSPEHTDAAKAPYAAGRLDERPKNIAKRRWRQGGANGFDRRLELVVERGDGFGDLAQARIGQLDDGALRHGAEIGDGAGAVNERRGAPAFASCSPATGRIT